MNDKIEVGEYVRTVDGKIFKLNEIEIRKRDIQLIDEFGQFGSYSTAVKKHSKNIIDLIELNDIVNGNRVIEIYTYKDEWEQTELRLDTSLYYRIIESDIETILTHEQYENNCYRLEN